MNKFLKSFHENIQIILLFTITFGVYIYCLSPSVFGGDSGDLLSAVIKKGVPHPSGYPLFTILGIIFSSLPINATFAWKVGLVSALSTSLTVCIFYLISIELTRHKTISFLSSLLLAFLYPIWLHAEIVEVLSLNGMFVMLLLYLTINYINTKNIKILHWISFFTGLSLTNNLTIILIFPAIILSIIFISFKKLLKLKTIMLGISAFFLGLLPYIYIPIAAVKNRSYSWGYAVNMKNFFSVVFRSEYGWGTNLEGYSLSNTAQLFSNYFYYWSTYIHKLLPIIVVGGILYLLVNKRLRFLFLLMASYLMVGPFYTFYARVPIKSLINIVVYEKFYISGILILCIFIPLGTVLILQILDRFKIRPQIKSLSKFAIYLLLISLIFSTFVTNLKKVDLSDSYIGDDYARDILKDMPVGSIAFLTGDTKVFNSYYIQNAYGFRKDIYIPGRPDSFRGLLEYLPMSEDEIEEYIVSRGGTLDRETYIKTLPLLVKNKDVYADHSLQNFQIEYEDLGKVVFIPWGLTKKLYFEKTYKVPKDEYISTMKSITDGFQVDKILKQGSIVDYSVNYADIQMSYASSYYAIADFIANYYQDPQSATFFLKRSIELDPLN